MKLNNGFLVDATGNICLVFWFLAIWMPMYRGQMFWTGCLSLLIGALIYCEKEKP